MSESTKSSIDEAIAGIEIAQQKALRRRVIDAYVAGLPPEQGGRPLSDEKKQPVASIDTSPLMNEKILHAKGQLARASKRNELRGMTNAEFAATNVQFRAACDEANIEPTARQASKWRARKGTAFFQKPAVLASLAYKKQEAQAEIVSKNRRREKITASLSNKVGVDEEQAELLTKELDMLNKEVSTLHSLIASLDLRYDRLKGARQ